MRKIMLAALSAALLGCTIEVVADSVTGSFTKTLTVEGPVELEVKSSSGSVEVLGRDGDEVRVVGKIRAGWGLGRDEAEQRVRRIERNPPVEVQDGVVRVGSLVSPAMLDHVSVSYEITIPKRAQVTVRSSSGSLTVEDVAGPAKLDASSGSVRASGVDRDVEVDVSSGSLTIEDVGGSLTADSSSGSQTFRRIAGNVYTRSSSGSVRLEEVGGEVDIRASSGSVRVHQTAAAPIKINSSSGSVHVETAGAAGYDFDLTSRSGGIGLPDDVSLTQDDKRHKKGSLRGGGPLIAVHASSGGVDLR